MSAAEARGALARRPNEPISDARHRRDPLFAVGGRTESLAELCYLDSEIALFDAGTRPGGIQQFGFGENVAVSRQQRTQEGQPPAPHCDRDAVLEQDPTI